MLALMMLLALGIYLAVSTLVVWLAVRIARKLNRRGWLWGAMAAFAMYNLVFWDWIPTLLMHKYYCATEAGFWIYKTPEQWDKENPGVLETLKPWSNPYGKEKYEINSTKARQFNDRFGTLDVRKENIGGFAIQRAEHLVMDLPTQEILGREVDFLSGPRMAGAVWKSWLVKDSCFVGKKKARIYFEEAEFVKQLKMMEIE